MIGALLLGTLLLQQGAPPQVRVSADRARIGVGEVVTVTITATSSDPRPVNITVNPPSGLSVVERLERREEGPGGVVTATLSLQLRGMEPGRWPVGPIRAMAGGEVTDVPGVTVDVGDPPDISVLISNPRLRALLQRAPPPTRPGDVTLRLLTSADSAPVGAQVDVAAAAWFPRDLRLQLRRPPVLQPPVIGGVWSRAQSAGSGLVTSRRVGGEWYDLFVAHQVVFPLAAGRITLPAATLRYGAPLGGPLSAPEPQTELTDGPRTLVAQPLPAGAPSGFTGAVGSGLRVTRRIDGEPRTGEGLTVEIVVSGRGNASLWPAPELQWPAGVRAYPDGTADASDIEAGLLGGSKTFRFAVVPERAGALLLPAVRYPYYDPQAAEYRDARLAAAAVAVRAAERDPAEQPRLPLMPGAAVAPARQAARAIPGWGWGLLLVLPVAFNWWRRRPARAPERSPAVTGAARFATSLANVADDADGAALAAHLRALGLPAATADAVLRVRQSLAEAAWGPGAGGVAPALQAEAERLAVELEALAPLPSPVGGIRSTAAQATDGRMAARGALGAVLGAAGMLASAGVLARLLVGSGLLIAVALAAQANNGAEAAYARGDAAQAAVRFLDRATREPDAAAHWYNLGAASLAAGDPTAAAAAFTRAARRAPRSVLVSRATARIVSADRDAREARRIVPVTADEAALAGLVLWWIGWLVWRTRRQGGRRWRGVAAAVLIGVGVVGLGTGALLRWRERQPVALVRAPLLLRRSPHERAETLGEVPEGAAVTVRARRGGWQRIAAAGGEGWVPAAQLVSLQE